MKTAFGRPVFYQEKVLGYVDGDHHFTPVLDALETQDLLTEEVSIAARVHLRTQAPGLYRLAHHHGLRPRDYITAYEAGIFALENAHGRSDLQHHAPVAWRLLHRTGLETKIFPTLQPV